MPIEVPLNAMTVAEKIQLLEKVWDNLCQESGDVGSPDWHRAVLEERTRRLETGKATISPWAEAKAKFLKIGQ